MAYVPIPKDLTRVRQKLILNLTKRQVICFSGGALIWKPCCGISSRAAICAQDAESIRPKTSMRCWKSRRSLKTR